MTDEELIDDIAEDPAGKIGSDCPEGRFHPREVGMTDEKSSGVIVFNSSEIQESALQFSTLEYLSGWRRFAWWSCFGLGMMFGWVLPALFGGTWKFGVMEGKRFRFISKEKP